MKRIVLDASVAVKWLPLFAHEPYVAEAQTWLLRRAIGDVALLVPGFFWVEVASVLWKAVRRQLCQPAEAETALETLRGLDIATLSTTSLVNPALTIALTHNRSVYDSLYVALAVRSKAEFLTADEKLANALAGHFSVKWLGAI